MYRIVGKNYDVHIMECYKTAKKTKKKQMKNEENFFDLIQGGFQAILLSKK